MRSKIILFLSLIVLFSCTSTNLDYRATNIEIFDDLWNEYNKQYAIFGVNNVDWEESYKKYRSKINNKLNDKELFDIICNMLDQLKDSHVRLITSSDKFVSGGLGKSEFDIDIAKSYLDNQHTVGDDNIIYGKIKNIGYIYIKTFTSDSFSTTLLDWALKIDDIIDYLYSCDSIILDIRSNGGGLPQTAIYIANRFADKKRIYQYISNKIGPERDDFSEKRGKYITPSGPKQFLKPVYLLTDNLSASATEDLVMAMRALPHVTQIGEGTRGIFSTHIARDLKNGWRYTMSIQRVTDENGICYEGLGMIPEDNNLIIYSTLDKINGKDTHIEFILNSL